jgi:hypothetical protein
MFLILAICMTLPVSLVGFAITAAYYPWLMLNGFPIGWGITGVIYCLWNMAGAYKLMKYLGQGGDQANSVAAACLPFAMLLILALYFTFSEYPFHLSAWWGTLLPVTFLLQLLLQAAFEFIFDFVNPHGRRK